jgi:LPS export ABC transporter protein LptC
MHQNGFKYFLALLYLTILYACGSSIDDPYDFYFNSPKLGETAKNVEILYSDSSYVQIRITGPLMHKSSEAGRSREEFPEGLKVEFLNNYGQVTSWLSAKHGIRSPSEDKVIFRDSVVLENTRWEKLKTSELIWNEKSGGFQTTRYFEITRPEEIIQGIGLKTNKELSEYEINAVTGRIKIEEIESDFQ